MLADRLPRMEYVAIAISLAALVISLLARRDTKRQADAAVRDVALAELQREEDQTAKRSADVSAHTTRAGGDPVLVVCNSGRAVARRVAVAIEVPIGDRGAPPIMDLDRFPCDLAPGADVTVGLMLLFGTAERLQISVTWTDELGPHDFSGLLPVP